MPEKGYGFGGDLTFPVLRGEIVWRGDDSEASLFLCRVGFSSDRLDGVLDVLHRQVGFFKCCLGHAEGRVKAFLRSEDREDVILGGDFYRCRSHGPPFLFDCAISVAFHTDCGNRRRGTAPAGGVRRIRCGNKASFAKTPRPCAIIMLSCWPGGSDAPDLGA